MMKNKIIPLLFFIFALPFSKAQQLVFKYKNFEKAVLENHDLNRDGKISLYEADSVEFIPDGQRHYFCGRYFLF